MKVSRDKVVGLMRQTGHDHVADIALRELPDPVDLDEVIAFGSKYGITRDDLISEMGGSP
ncbi:MAG: hypothetical protein JO016_17180 [Actinobacteria bacterium]|nr:hypothetical protein [Actinomycetota bacterium]